MYSYTPREACVKIFQRNTKKYGSYGSFPSLSSPSLRSSLRKSCSSVQNNIVIVLWQLIDYLASLSVSQWGVVVRMDTLTSNQRGLEDV